MNGEHKDSRTAAQRRFVRAETALNNAMVEGDIPIKLLEQRYNEVKQQWKELQVAHDNYIIKELKDVEQSVIAKEDELIDGFASRFSQIEIAAYRKIRDASAVTNANDTGAAKQKPFIKLECLKFPMFDGNVRNYPKFKSEFEKYIKPMCGIDQLPIVIKQYLSESVRRDVDNFDTTAAIWKRLDSKYGSKQKLVDAIMQDIKGLSNCDSDDSAIIAMITAVENAHYDLAKLNEEAEMDNSTILSIIEQQMSRAMFDEWVQIVASLEPKQKFSKLLPFLENWKLRIEYTMSGIRNASHSAGSKAKIKCWLHKNCEHPIWRCRLFQGLPLSERIELAKSHEACFSCLETGHCPCSCFC